MKQSKRNKSKRTGIRTIFNILIIAVIAVAFVYITDDIITHRIYPLKYSEYIQEYSEKYNVPKHTICAVIETESGFDRLAVSPKGAIGLMQITPETFRWLCEYTDIGGEYDESLLYDARTNIKYGTYFMSYLYDKFGSWEVAHAAYNAGMNRVSTWLKDERISKDGELINIPIAETRRYIEKINKAKEVYFETYFSDVKGQNDHE